MNNKITLLIATALFTATTLHAQTRTLDKIYNTFDQFDGVVKLELPGWVVKKGIEIDEIDDEGLNEGIKTLAKHIKKLRILVVEDRTATTEIDFAEIMPSLRKESFEDYLMVREGKTRVNLMVREKRNKIRNILLLVDAEEELVMLSMKTKIRRHELEEIPINL